MFECSKRWESWQQLEQELVEARAHEEEEAVQAPLPLEVPTQDNYEVPSPQSHPSSPATIHYRPFQPVRPDHLSSASSLLLVHQRQTSRGIKAPPVLLVPAEEAEEVEGQRYDEGPEELCRHHSWLGQQLASA